MNEPGSSMSMLAAHWSSIDESDGDAAPVDLAFGHCGITGRQLHRARHQQAWSTGPATTPRIVEAGAMHSERQRRPRRDA